MNVLLPAIWAAAAKAEFVAESWAARAEFETEPFWQRAAEALAAEFAAAAVEAREAAEAAEFEAEAARHDAHHCGLGWCPDEDNCQYLVGV